MATALKSLNAQRALRQLGTNVKQARLKRRMALQDLADRASVSKRTIARLENGESGVSVGTLAMICLVLGELERIELFLDPSSDDTGLVLDSQNLPKRIARSRKPAVKSEKPSPKSKGKEIENREGIGF
jgi:transcriptional regulator with XRE-family HTH domain